MAKVLELQLQHQSFQWIFRTDFLLDWLVWSPCSPRDSRESYPTPLFKSSIPQHSAFFIVQLLHPYMTTGKTIALTRWTFVGKVMSLLFNMLSRLVITFHISIHIYVCVCVYIYVILSIQLCYDFHIVLLVTQVQGGPQRVWHQEVRIPGANLEADHFSPSCYLFLYSSLHAAHECFSCLSGHAQLGSQEITVNLLNLRVSLASGMNACLWKQVSADLQLQ